ncbi:hypothetical protein [Azospirillum thiophilum]|uniref:hypothetical protein n=1 Tax=Azospirillum thiophilum TaxID=528244 RepID=UPI00128CE9A7|nr:hypothetical protein [Azospirillum thiophilum]
MLKISALSIASHVLLCCAGRCLHTGKYLLSNRPNDLHFTFLIALKSRSGNPDGLVDGTQTTSEFWLNLQMAHDLSATAADHGEEIQRSIAPRAA